MGAVRTAGWSKRIDTKVSILLGLHLPLFLRSVKIGERRPLRKRGTAEDFFFRRGAQCAPIPRNIRSVRYRTATHAVSSTQARHIRVAQLFGLIVTAGTCEFCTPIKVTFMLYRRVRRLGAPHLSGLHDLYRRGDQWPPTQRRIITKLRPPHSCLTEALNNAKKEPSFEDSFLCNFGLLSGEITPQP